MAVDRREAIRIGAAAALGAATSPETNRQPAVGRPATAGGGTGRL